MENIDPHSNIYLDTGFLLRVFSTCEEPNEKEIQLLSDILLLECNVFISVISAVEFIKVLKDLERDKLPQNKKRAKWNKFFRNHNCKLSLLLKEGLGYPPLEEKIREALQSFKEYTFVDSPDAHKLIEISFENLIGGYIKNPMDSFHYAYSLSNDCKYMIVRDKDFRKGIKKLGQITPIPF